MSVTRTTALRERMREDMRLRNYALSTETSTSGMSANSLSISASPQNSSECLRSGNICAILWLRGTLRHKPIQAGGRGSALPYTPRRSDREWLKGRIPYPRSPKTLPEVLTVDEVQRLFECTQQYS